MDFNTLYTRCGHKLKLHDLADIFPAAACAMDRDLPLQEMELRKLTLQVGLPWYGGVTGKEASLDARDSFHITAWLYDDVDMPHIFDYDPITERWFDAVEGLR